MGEQRCDGLNRWRRQREARDIGREMCDKNGQDGKCLDECVRGYSRLHRDTIRFSNWKQNDARTVASWANNLGVSFAHAFTVIVPSVGSSAVIVLRAVNPCYLEV
jgi:hypothetical protein